MHSTKVFVRGTDKLQEIEKEEWSFIIIITFMGRTKTGFMMLFFSIVLCKYTLATCRYCTQVCNEKNNTLYVFLVQDEEEDKTFLSGMFQ